MISYKEATEIVTKELQPKWEFGTFYVEPKGYENDEIFMVPYGAKEFLVDDDDEFMVTDYPVAFVNKETGELDLVDYLSNRDLIVSLNPM